MEIDEIIKIILDLDNVSDKYKNDQAFLVAVYLYVRYGVHKCKYYIDNADLEKIAKEIGSRESLFDEDLNYTIEEILKAKE